MFNALCITGSCIPTRLSDDYQKARRTAAFLKITAFVLGLLCVAAAIVLNVQNVHMTAAHSLGSIGGLLMLGSFVLTIVHFLRMKKVADQQYDQMVRLDTELLAKSKEVESVLKKLAAENKVDEIRNLLQEQIPEDQRNFIGGKSYNKKREEAKPSLLFYAVLRGHFDVAQLLITEYNMKVRMIVDEEHNTFLPTYLIHRAVGNVRDNLRCIDLLLQTDPALLNLRKPKRTSPMWDAPYEWDVGYTPLEEALTKLKKCVDDGERSVLRAKILYLIEQGAELNGWSTFPERTCALWLAIEIGPVDIAIIEALSKRGAIWYQDMLAYTQAPDYQSLMHAGSIHERFERIVK